MSQFSMKIGCFSSLLNINPYHIVSPTKGISRRFYCCKCILEDSTTSVSPSSCPNMGGYIQRFSQGLVQSHGKTVLLVQIP